MYRRDQDRDNEISRTAEKGESFGTQEELNALMAERAGLKQVDVPDNAKCVHRMDPCDITTEMVQLRPYKNDAGQIVHAGRCSKCGMVFFCQDETKQEGKE